MNFNKIKLATYALFLTNIFGFKLKNIKDPLEKKRVRLHYTKTLLAKLQIAVTIKNKEKIPLNGQYLVISNHRGIIDPLILEMALAKTDIFGLWISKKELYTSPFFGMFVRNAGAILLDREKSQMSGFFADIKSNVKNGSSIFIFPEGTRNKSDIPLIEFKDGFRIIALKNRLPILPLYIKTDAGKALKNALEDKNLAQEITIVVGDLIDYKDKTSLEENYKKTFAL